MEVKLYDLIINSAEKGLSLQNKNGSFPKGTNGPWKDQDTYVRTTAHWALLLYKSYEITENEKFYLSAIKACDYILDKDNRPFDYSFFCRESNDKDKCNGLIGQAWTLEPLIIIGKKSNIDYYLKVAEEIILENEYSNKDHLWKTLEIDGTYISYHSTINQQIWMTVMTLILGDTLKNNKLIEISEDFFENLPKHIEYINRKGLIKHTRKQKFNLRQVLKKLMNKNRIKVKEKETEERSIGYLSFILHGFALAYDICPNYHFWSNKELKNIISKAYCYIEQNEPYGYLEAEDSFRWSYNPVGIEMAYTTQALSKYINIKNHKIKIEKWLSLQIQGYYNDEDKLMNNNTIDSNILASRLYEAINMNNCILKPSYWHENVEKPIC